MLIDWFTVIAQLVNFLVLVWLLKRYLYKPILNAIDLREKRIAAEISTADAKKAEAEKQFDEFKNKNREFEQQKRALTEQLNAEIKVQRTQLCDVVRLESEALRNKWHTALKNEQLNLQESLSLRAQEEIFAIARKVLDELAGTTLEERMAAILTDRLGNLNNTEKDDLKLALQASPSPIIIHSCFNMRQQQCLLIETAIRDILGNSAQIKFVTNANISGIEINANGHKITWSIADYLDTLSESVQQLLNNKTNQPTATEQANHEKNA